MKAFVIGVIATILNVLSNIGSVYLVNEYEDFM